MFQKTDTVHLFWKIVWQGEQVASVASASSVYSQLCLSCFAGLSCFVCKIDEWHILDLWIKDYGQSL